MAADPRARRRYTPDEIRQRAMAIKKKRKKKKATKGEKIMIVFVVIIILSIFGISYYFGLT